MSLRWSVRPRRHLLSLTSLMSAVLTLVIVSHRKLCHIIPEFLDHCLARVCGSTRWQIIESGLCILLFLTDGKITKMREIWSDVIMMIMICGYVSMWSDRTRHDASQHVELCGPSVACCLCSLCHPQTYPQMFVNKLWSVEWINESLAAEYPTLHAKLRSIYVEDVFPCKWADETTQQGVTHRSGVIAVRKNMMFSSQ